MELTALRRSAQLRHSIRGQVAALGDAPDAVASSLAAQGVRGVPGDSRNCAVARYLHVTITSETTVQAVTVAGRTLRVHRRGWRLPVSVRLPDGVSAFIRNFDTGGYPALVEPSAGDCGDGGGGFSQETADLSG